MSVGRLTYNREPRDPIQVKKCFRDHELPCILVDNRGDSDELEVIGCSTFRQQ